MDYKRIRLGENQAKASFRIKTRQRIVC